MSEALCEGASPKSSPSVECLWQSFVYEGMVTRNKEADVQRQAPPTQNMLHTGWRTAPAACFTGNPRLSRTRRAHWQNVPEQGQPAGSVCFHKSHEHPPSLLPGCEMPPGPPQYRLMVSGTDKVQRKGQRACAHPPRPRQLSGGVPREPGLQLNEGGRASQMECPDRAEACRTWQP